MPEPPILKITDADLATTGKYIGAADVSDFDGSIAPMEPIMVPFTESELRARAQELGVATPDFTQASAPEPFKQWAAQVELLAMLDEKRIYLPAEIAEANRRATALDAHAQ